MAPTLVAVLRENDDCIFIKSAKTDYTVRKGWGSDMTICLKDKISGKIISQQKLPKEAYQFTYYPEKKQLCLNLNNEGEFLLGILEDKKDEKEREKIMKIAQNLTKINQTTAQTLR